MEPLSGVASGMAVVSLSLQLIQSVSTIHAFVRTVRGAPTELNRLIESLECLHALLQDICQVIELQSSRLGHSIPMPSMTIFNCLKRCEKHLQPLQGIVQKYDIQDKSSSRRLWSSIKFGFKTSDIMAAESRIQQEMANLNTALVLNNTSIQLNAFPILMKSQHSVSISSSPQQSHLPHGEQTEATSTTHHYTSPDMPSSVLVAQRVFHSPSYLKRFGFSRYKILCTLRTKQAGQSSSKQIEKEAILQEEYVYSWAAVWFGYGLRSSRTRPYGSILPSLTVYPVVSEYSRGIRDLILHGTVLELQQAFHMGILHPATRDKNGETLFHLAARTCRVDLCQLFVQVGMKAEDTDPWNSLLKLAVYTSWAYELAPDLRSTTDTCRFLLENAQFSEITKWMVLPRTSIEDPRVAEWLLQTGTSYMYGQETTILTEFCIQQLVILLRCLPTRNDAFTILKKFLMSKNIQPAGPELTNWLFRMDWIGALYKQLFEFEWYDVGELLSQLDSFDIGKVFVDLLLALEVDVKLFIVEQQEKYSKWEGNGIKSGPQYDIIFDYIEGRGWILGFEWIYDAQDPGFLVVSEYSIMATDAREEDLGHWPYGLRKYDRILPAMKKFDRCMAAKARKELKRTGQRRVQDKMPGSWIS